MLLREKRSTLLEEAITPSPAGAVQSVSASPHGSLPLYDSFQVQIPNEQRPAFSTWPRLLNMSDVGTGETTLADFQPRGLSCPIHAAVVGRVTAYEVYVKALRRLLVEKEASLYLRS